MPSILHWKAMVALFAVVIGGASIGSALHSPQTAKRRADYRPTIHRYVLGPEYGPITVNITGSIHDTKGTVTPLQTRRLRRQACAMFKREAPKSEWPLICSSSH